MAHVLLLGMTLSGKTHKAKSLSRDYKAAGAGVLVLDPLLDPEWQADFITDDPNKFLDVFWKSRSCMAFMDEGGESVGRYDIAMQKTATRGRHWGHTCHYIAQRATQLSPLVRDQCTRLFLFCSSNKDGQVLSHEWNRPELEECSQLKQGEYYYAVKMGSITSNRSTQNERSISNSAGAGDNAARRDSEPRKRQGRVRGQTPEADRGSADAGTEGTGRSGGKG